MHIVEYVARGGLGRRGPRLHRLTTKPRLPPRTSATLHEYLLPRSRDAQTFFFEVLRGREGERERPGATLREGHREGVCICI